MAVFLLFAPPETLIRALDLVTTEEGRIDYVRRRLVVQFTQNVDQPRVDANERPSEQPDKHGGKMRRHLCVCCEAGFREVIESAVRPAGVPQTVPDTYDGVPPKSPHRAV